MTRTSLFLITCAVLFLLGNLYITETSGAIIVKPPRMKSRYLTSRLHNALVIPEIIEEEIHITRRSEDGFPMIVDAAGNDLMNNEVKLNEGESKTYECKYDKGRIYWEYLLEKNDLWKHYSSEKRLTIRGDMTLNKSQFRCFSINGNIANTSANVLQVTVIPKPKTTPANPTGAARSWSRVNDTTVHMIYNYDVKTTVTCKCGNDDAIHATRLTGNTWSIQIPDKTCTYKCTDDFNIDIENKDDTGRYFKNWRVEGQVVKWTAQQPGIVFTVAHRCKANNRFISDGNVTSEAFNDQMSLNLTFPTNMAGKVAVILKFTWKHGATTRSMEREFTFKIGKDGSTVVENSETDKANTDPPKTTSDPNHWTITVLYITNGATGFILIVLIAVFTIRRCRRRSSGEGHVDTSTQPQQLETGEGHVDTSTAQQQLETTNDELNIYEDPDDRNPENVSKRKLLRNTGLQQSHKAMRAEKENDTTPHMAMEAGKGKDTTPYMDMGPGIEEDTYMSTEGPIDVTTPSARGDTDTDQYMNPEALKKTTYP
ncbi:uncharacterized protein LOC141907819 [Tubulanus polymorphus]|uniref:uncharacterized protein LOC141907819 n=1 Tax=Tubulanus polymorphus TaxID=672921 RepID=UPI003DA2F219